MFRNVRKRRVCPKWISRAVGSKPIFTLRGVFLAREVSNFLRSSSSPITSTACCVIVLS